MEGRNGLFGGCEEAGNASGSICKNDSAENGCDNEARQPSLDDDASDYGDVIGLTAEDICKKVFRSEERAYDFFAKLGKFLGFGVRKGDYGKDEEGNLIRRRFFCNKAGLRDQKHYNRVDRKRSHRPETRTNCKSMLSVYLDRVSWTWKVRKVNLEHNHPLTPRIMVHMIPGFRRMSDSAKAHIDGMQRYGLPTSKILGYMAGISGGYSLLGFTKKDAYNYIEKSKRDKITDGDTNAAVIYLEGKATADPMSMARYNLTDDGMLANLFWADGASRVDYQYFGDVLAFDSTYKKNKYKRPLVIFSGTNNHKQTTIFGFGLVLDERIPSYTWMLESLVEVMCGKTPSVVVTDGDDAMIAAVRKVFPRATHRLCAWHLQRNVTSNSNEEMFRNVFAKWLYADMEIADFEAEWAQAVIDFELSDKLWASQMYEKRVMWANAYLRNKFCAGFRTTSRCEGINANVKKFLTSRHSILELVQNLELLVREYRNNELLAQFNTLYSMPVITGCLDSIERSAANVYTRAVFNEVKKEMDRVGTVNFVSRKRVSTTILYITEDYGNPGRRVMTLFENNVVKLECRCRFWERVGYPCRHMFFVMKHEHLKAIPDHLIIKRWRQDAKDIGQYVDDIEEESERGFLLRHGALHAASQWMLFVGAKKQELFRVALNGIRNVCRDLENGNAKAADGASKRVDVGIRDPVVVRTKGAPSSKKLKSKKRRCTSCRKTGHTKRRCTVSRRSFNEANATKGADISNRDRAKNVEAECTKGGTRAGVDVDVLEELQSGDQLRHGDRIVCTGQSQNMQSLGDQNEPNWETLVMDILKKLNPGAEANC